MPAVAGFLEPIYAILPKGVLPPVSRLDSPRGRGMARGMLLGSSEEVSKVFSEFGLEMECPSGPGVLLFLGGGRGSPIWVYCGFEVQQFVFG